jgi:hypothetical protein
MSGDPFSGYSVHETTTLPLAKLVTTDIGAVGIVAHKIVISSE